MSSGHWRVKPSEIERALRSIQSVGLHIRNVEVGPNGTIKIDVTENKESVCDNIETAEQLRRLL